MRFIRHPIEQRTYHGDFNNPDDQEVVTWWYSGLVKSKVAGHQPKVLICFRKVLDGNELGDFLFRRVPITELGQFEIGTIWKGKASREEILMKEATFQLDFDADTWHCRSVEDLLRKEGAAVMRYTFDNNSLLLPTHVLQFPTSEDNLGFLTPSLEFFSRCYGRSQHVKRILTTFPLTQAEDELFAPLVEPAAPGMWAINLRQRTVNGDTAFLAHLRYDKYTKEQTRKIWGQLEGAQGAIGNEPAFPQIGPWFRGAARIKARGLWLIEGKRFLGLQIIGCSDPGGVPIYRDRQNTNKTGPLAEGQEPGKSWNGVPGKVPKPPPIIRVNSIEKPGGDTASINIEDRKFEILGQPRVIIDVRRANAQSSKGDNGNAPDPESFSGDEAQGRGKTVGYGSFRATAVMESHGALRDVWDALRKLKVAKPKLVQELVFYTPEDNFCADEEPKLIALEAFTEEEKNEIEDSYTRNWPLLDPKTGTPRGILLARILTPKGHVFFLEVQRRARIVAEEAKPSSETPEHSDEPNKKSDSSKSKKKQFKEEAYKGMVFMLDDPTQLGKWLEKLCTEVRKRHGILNKLVSFCPGKADTFSHTPAGSEKWPCERAVLNGLKKLDITE